METQTNGTIQTFTTNSIYNCAGCINSVDIACGECGHVKKRCSRLNIDIPEDSFYCKYWCGKYNSTGTYTTNPYQWTYTVNVNPGNIANQQ